MTAPIREIIDRLEKVVNRPNFKHIANLFSHKNYIRADVELKKIMMQFPNDLQVQFNYGYNLIQTGFTQKAKDLFEQIIYTPGCPRILQVQAISNYWLCCDYLGISASQRLHIEPYYDSTIGGLAILPQDKIKIAYISEDLYNHSIGNAFLHIIKATNKEKFETYIYHTSDKEDSITKAIQKECDHFIYAQNQQSEYPMPSDDIFKQLRENQVQIFVDLGGHTNGGKRLNLFCQRPCPIQITMLGYPFDTGLDCFDLHIPGMPYFQTQKPDDSITIGCLSSPCKINKSDIQFYDEILTQRKDIELVYARLGMQYTQEKTDEIMSMHSIANHNRISILNLNIPYKTMLEMFDAIVDTDQWPAHALLQDALSMGIPIIYNDNKRQHRHGNDAHIQTGLYAINYNEVKKRRQLSARAQYIANTMLSFDNSKQWTSNYEQTILKLYNERLSIHD
jgi:Predicted O-linked N-acetylglucosamine transferase, SPINDLY family